MEVIEEWIYQVLAAEPRLSAREITNRVSRVGVIVNRSEVNSLLYSSNRFMSEGDSPPLWSVETLFRKFDDTVSPANTLKALPPLPAPPRLELYEWQGEAYKAWREANKCGVIEAVTGTGKTRLGIAAAIGHAQLRGKTLVVVPSVMLMDQWVKELERMLPRVRIGRFYSGARSTFVGHDVIVAVVNSVRGCPFDLRGNTGLLIADECHRYGSDQNHLALDKGFRYRLGLSATYARTDSGNQEYLDPYFGRVVFRIGYKRALAERVVSPFIVALYGVDLPGAELAEYIAEREEASKLRTKLIRAYEAPEEPFGEFMKVVSRFADGDAPSYAAVGIARKYLAAFAAQRRIVAESTAKLDAIMDLVSTIRRASRTIVFTETKEAAEEVAELLRRNGLLAEAIHSGHANDERKVALAAFHSGRLTVLVAPRILDEGIDVPAADLGIIVASSKTRRQMIQRMGRVIRKAEGKKIARFVVLFARETSEDPAEGAHETFLEEMAYTAHRIRQFDTTDPHALTRFLWSGYKVDVSDEFPSLQRADRNSRPEIVPLSTGRRVRVDPAQAKPSSTMPCPWCAQSVQLVSVGPELWRLADAHQSFSVHECASGRRLDKCDTDALPRLCWSRAMELLASRRSDAPPDLRKAPPPRPKLNASVRVVSTPFASDGRTVRSKDPVYRSWTECSSCGTRIAGSLSVCARCLD